MLAAALLACAINVAPSTMDAIVSVESGYNPIAINVNRAVGKPVIGPQHPASRTEAAAIARKYIAAGYTVDVGYAQWNSRNFIAAGFTVEAALDPCYNLAGAAGVLSTFYAKAAMRFGEGQRALMSALSAYNAGDFDTGFANGYVAKYYISANLPQPARPVAMPTQRVFPTTIAYDRPGLDMRLNRTE